MQRVPVTFVVFSHFQLFCAKIWSLYKNWCYLDVQTRQCYEDSYLSETVTYGIFLNVSLVALQVGHGANSWCYFRHYIIAQVHAAVEGGINWISFCRDIGVTLTINQVACLPGIYTSSYGPSRCLSLSRRYDAISSIQKPNSEKKGNPCFQCNSLCDEVDAFLSSSFEWSKFVVC